MGGGGGGRGIFHKLLFASPPPLDALLNDLYFLFLAVIFLLCKY